MGIKEFFKEIRARYISLGHPSQPWVMYSPNTASKVVVTEDTALNLSAVYCAVRLISGSIAGLPWQVFEDNNPGKRKAPEHPVYFLLHDNPNPETTSVVFRETLLHHLLLWGNAYAEIEFTTGGTPLYLWNVCPNRVTPDRDNAGNLIYRVQDDQGKERVLPKESILHIPGLSYNGITGLSIIGLARESLGIATAQEQHAAKLFGQGTVLSGIITHPSRPTETAIANIKREWKEQYAGNPYQTPVLIEGMTYQPLGMTSQDAEFLASRAWSLIQIAQWFGLNPIMIGDNSKATFNNVEQMNIQFVQYTLKNYLDKLEAEVNRKLFRPDERFFNSFNLNGLLRGDIKTRYESYQIAINAGWMNADMIADLEDINRPPEGLGSRYVMPLNMEEKSTLDVNQILTVLNSSVPDSVKVLLLNNIAPELGLSEKDIANEQPATTDGNQVPDNGVEGNNPGQ